jgi:hypothetical protein
MSPRRLVAVALRLILRTLKSLPLQRTSGMEKPASGRLLVRGAGHRDRRGSMRLPATTFCAVLASLLVACSIMRPDTAPAAEEYSAVRPADTSSPRATLKSFIDSCNELQQIIQTVRHFDRTSSKHHPLAVRILDCLDLSELPEYAREDIAGESAMLLKEILDRVELPPYDEIPDSKAIEAAGGIEKLSRWQIPGTRLTIARVEEGPSCHIVPRVRKYPKVLIGGIFPRRPIHGWRPSWISSPTGPASEDWDWQYGNGPGFFPHYYSRSFSWGPPTSCKSRWSADSVAKPCFDTA